MSRAAGSESGLERVKGIEPSYAAWEAAVLPLNYARKRAPSDFWLRFAFASLLRLADTARSPDEDASGKWHIETASGSGGHETEVRVRSSLRSAINLLRTRYSEVHAATFLITSSCLAKSGCRRNLAYH